jgi:hypothetical protein
MLRRDHDGPRAGQSDKCEQYPDRAFPADAHAAKPMAEKPAPPRVCAALPATWAKNILFSRGSTLDNRGEGFAMSVM